MNSLALNNQAHTVPQVQEFQLLMKIAEVAIDSRIAPAHVKTKEQALFLILKGREMGVPPIAALNGLIMVNGKITQEAQLMSSLIFKHIPGAIVDYVESTDKICVIEAQRPKGKRTRFSFTIEEAKQAKLTDKDNWKKWPAAMLRARCLAIVARAVFPDALQGVVYTPDEMGAEIDDEGSITNLPPESKDVGQTHEPEQEALALAEATRKGNDPSNYFDIPEDASKYICKVGTLKGNLNKALSELPVKRWIGYVTYLHSTLKAGVPASAELQELAEAVTLYALQEGYNLDQLALLKEEAKKQLEESKRAQ